QKFYDYAYRMPNEVSGELAIQWGVFWGLNLDVPSVAGAAPDYCLELKLGNVSNRGEFTLQIFDSVSSQNKSAVLAPGNSKAIWFLSDFTSIDPTDIQSIKLIHKASFDSQNAICFLDFRIVAAEEGAHGPQPLNNEENDEESNEEYEETEEEQLLRFLFHDDFLPFYP
ncbi:MAG: hypothetical protein AAF585_28285, partial [Verrucomicrobiota bacterium]